MRLITTFNAAVIVNYRINSECPCPRPLIRVYTSTNKWTLSTMDGINLLTLDQEHISKLLQLPIVKQSKVLRFSSLLLRERLSLLLVLWIQSPEHIHTHKHGQIKKAKNCYSANFSLYAFVFNGFVCSCVCVCVYVINASA